MESISPIDKSTSKRAFTRAGTMQTPPNRGVTKDKEINNSLDGGDSTERSGLGERDSKRRLSQDPKRKSYFD